MHKIKMKYWFLTLSWFLSFYCAAEVAAVNDGKVTGQIQMIKEIEENGTFKVIITGWACQKGVAKSTWVTLYDKPFGLGVTAIGGVLANKPSQASTNSACYTSGVAHNFELSIPRGDALKYLGKPLYVYGLAFSGTNADNFMLPESGKLYFPSSVSFNLSEKIKLLTASRDLIINSTEKVYIDSTATLGVLTVKGQLLCREGNTYASDKFKLNAKQILVNGPGSRFQCGANIGAPFMGLLEVRLTPPTAQDLNLEHTMSDHCSMANNGDFLACNGGMIKLIGNGNGVTKKLINGEFTTTGWTYISRNVKAGTAILDLDPTIPLVGWKADDEIIIGPTGFNANEAEKRTIKSIIGNQVTINEPLTYSHYGETQTYANENNTWKLDERAEVANLTRNIKISTSGDQKVLDQDQLGAHMMIMPGSTAFIDGVEFVQMGQQGVLGRYPFHWHLVGDATNQFIRNSSIHDSYQRCLSIHGTHKTLVNNNVCYNHFGHGYFLENGSETGNKITNNLSMKSKRIPGAKALLLSDVDVSESGIDANGRDMASYTLLPFDITRASMSSGFWISNPNNIVTGNRVSGAEGTGFWMSFNRQLICEPADPNDCFVPTYLGDDPMYTRTPAREITAAFNNNVAHGADVGMTWDAADDGVIIGSVEDTVPGRTVKTGAIARRLTAAHYYYDSIINNPSENEPVFENLEVFKNRLTGIYYRGSTATFENLIAADNPASLFFAYNQIVKGGLVVGLSSNNTEDELKWLGNDTWLKTKKKLNPFHGVRLYDGPFNLEDVHFAGFSDNTIASSAWYKPVPFFSIGGTDRFVNSVKRLTFEKGVKPRKMYDFSTSTWDDSRVTSAIRDLDGSLTGISGRLIQPNEPYNNDDTCRTLNNVPIDPTWDIVYNPLAPIDDQVLACTHDIGIMKLGYTANSLKNTIIVDFEAIRTNNTTQSIETISPAKGLNFNKVNLITGNSFNYKILFKAPGGINEKMSELRIDWKTESPMWSPIVEFDTVKQAANSPKFLCDPNFSEAIAINDLNRRDPALTIKQVGSLQDLKNQTGNEIDLAFYKHTDGKVYTRFYSSKPHLFVRSGNAATSNTIVIKCN